MRSKSVGEKKELIGISSQIAHNILKRGFMVHRYISFTTNSVYLKVDAGVCHSIRISDHSGKEHLGYRYNIRTDVEDPTGIQGNAGTEQYFYSKDDVDTLIKMIVESKEKMLKKYGERTYMKFVNRELEANEKSKGFWKSAQLLSLRNMIAEEKIA